MESPVLTDRSVVPNDDLIFSIIGNNRVHWIRLMEEIRSRYPDALEQWNYYNDGKSWLFRIIRKKKTLFWIGVFLDTFRITFYFSDKAEALIERSDLPESIKDEFKNGKRFGKIRAVSIRVKHAEDIVNALILADIRVELK